VVSVIPVARRPAPAGFDEHVREPGLKWIASRAHVNLRFPSYWSWCEPHLREAFRTRCGWAAMSITSGVVEHFVSQAEARVDRPELVYDWDNYRYAMPEINSRKGKSDLLDPFDVRPGWFRISLPSLRLRMTDAIPREYRERARRTLEQLDLDRGFQLMRLRERYMRRYREGSLTLRVLEEDAPLIAAAIRELFDTPAEELDEAMLAYRTELFAARQRAGASVP
jgi:hypothetical protein